VISVGSLAASVDQSVMTPPDMGAAAASTSDRWAMSAPVINPPFDIPVA
jgi:hypothetical protein